MPDSASSDQQGGAFARAFLPGLVLGLVIGGVCGAVLPPLIDGSRRIETTGGGTHDGASQRERDDAARQAEEQRQLDEVLHQAEQQGEDAADNVTTPPASPPADQP